MAEKSLAEALVALQTSRDALDALKRVDPASAAAIEGKVASTAKDVRQSLSNLTGIYRAEREDARRELEIASRAAFAKSPYGADEAAIRQVFRAYERAYEARSLEALERLQVLTPADVKALRALFADVLYYQVAIDTESFKFSSDAREAIVSARIVHTQTRSRGLTQEVAVATFVMEKRKKSWMIVKVSRSG